MSQDACRPPIAVFADHASPHRADHVAPELRAKPDRAGATLGRTPAYGCRFQKLHPSEWRQPNQNMIAVDDRNWPAFRPVAVGLLQVAAAVGSRNTGTAARAQCLAAAHQLQTEVAATPGSLIMGLSLTGARLSRLM